jgi:hypothetical protein
MEPGRLWERGRRERKLLVRLRTGRASEQVQNCFMRMCLFLLYSVKSER